MKGSRLGEKILGIEKIASQIEFLNQKTRAHASNHVLDPQSLAQHFQGLFSLARSVRQLFYSKNPLSSPFVFLPLFSPIRLSSSSAPFSPFSRFSSFPPFSPLFFLFSPFLPPHSSTSSFLLPHLHPSSCSFLMKKLAFIKPSIVARTHKTLSRKDPLVISFDPVSRLDYLTGFHKRKVAKQKKEQDQRKEWLRQEKADNRRTVRFSLFPSPPPPPSFLFSLFAGKSYLLFPPSFDILDESFFGGIN